TARWHLCMGFLQPARPRARASSFSGGSAPATAGAQPCGRGGHRGKHWGGLRSQVIPRPKIAKGDNPQIACTFKNGNRACWCWISGSQEQIANKSSTRWFSAVAGGTFEQCPERRHGHEVASWPSSPKDCALSSRTTEQFCSMFSTGISFA